MNPPRDREPRDAEPSRPRPDRDRHRAHEGDGGSDPLRWDLLEDPAPTANGGTRRWLLPVLAVVPWIVIAALLVQPPGAAPETSGSEDPGADVAGAGDAHAGAEGPGATTLTTDPRADLAPQGPTDGADDLLGDHPLPELDAIRVGGRATAGTGEAAAVATLVARAWLGDVGAALDADVGSAGTGAYVEHLTVEAVDFPAPGAAVVSVVAVLLDVEDGAYSAARAVRVAVPVSLARDGARPAGSPWWLPTPDLQPYAGDWRAVEDPDVLIDAGAAVAAAGYRDVEVVGLEHSGGWALRATVNAVAPGQDEVGEHVLWLREHLRALVVAGWLPEPPEGAAADDAGAPPAGGPPTDPTP